MLLRRTRTAKFVLSRAANQLLNWVYPENRPTCVVCKRPMFEETVTDASLDISSPPGICTFCLKGRPCDTRRPIMGQVPLHTGGRMAILCAAQYEGWLRDALRHWKYDQSVQLTPWFAHLMAQATVQVGRPRWDYIVPVPTAKDRALKRGYDHVGLLAHQLSQVLKVPLLPVLERVTQVGADSHHVTQSQTTRSARERAQALIGQFARRQNTVDLYGKSLLLVDDVVTTGATMQACGNLLANSMDSSIHALAIAHVQ